MGSKLAEGEKQSNNY